jgi:hypothetical protein
MHRRAGAGTSDTGDLLVTRDESQSDYVHAVPKTSRQISGSNLTQDLTPAGDSENFGCLANIGALLEAFLLCEGYR